ncbi:hypothetical protein U14_03905 [Candidatus Moduliflexus flocculans]|uniref:Lipoprotein n=1 Tax=Candidatus Moduliflexus flocculans TaxID=1499966 RepID=A0A081BQI6_9BACT|nr:hypothetical protein U14_03905 [Candidatus Moduliflexus flocculans]
MYRQNMFYKIALILLVTSAWMTGCEDPVSDDPDTACIRTGLHEYTLTMTASGQNRYYTGRTTLQSTDEGFFFTGGEENRRELTVTCVDESYALVDITLHNRCASEFVTRAASTMDIFGDGSMAIAPYLIEWTCGTGTSTTARESWTLDRL